MDTQADEGVEALDAFLPDGLEDAYPMSELQVGMVYEMERDPDRLPYHNVHTLRMSGTFDEACFRGAVARVVARHPILRTSFDLVGFSEPMQLVHAAAEVPLTVADLRALSGDTAREALAQYIGAERRTPLDVAVPPLCRMGVHVLADDAFQWTFTEHHSILDGWSLASVVAEITDLYRRLLAGDRPVTAPLESTYRDFIAAEREALESPESKEFWRDRLSELPDGRLPRWPADRASLLCAEPVPGERHLHDESQGFGSLISPLPQDLTPRLRDLARQCRVPVKSVLLAAHAKVMSLITGSPDIVVGLTANGRLEETDGADVVGLFVNTLPFRMQLPGGSWRELIRAVFEHENELLPHRRYPMAALQRELGGSALFETNFVYTDFQQIDAAPADTGSGGKSFGDVARTHFALVAAFVREPGADGLLLELEYDARTLHAAQLAVLRDYYVRVLDEMVTTPEAAHRWASLLGENERALLETWNATATDVPSTPIHRLVEARAEASPDAVALVSGSSGKSLTYRELNARANRVARQLRELGVGVDTAVGVCVERSIEMVVSWLAVLKAGGMYVPMDPGMPAARLEFMLTQSGASLVLTAGNAVRSVPEGPWRALVVDESLWGEAAGNAANLPDGAGLDNACYVIFTSGSTGQPKGVVTRHRNVTELLYGGDVMTVLPEDTVLQIAPAAFDVSTFEVWAPLVGGARLVLAPPVRYGPAEIATWVAQWDVTVLHATASLFALLVDHEPQTFDGLRRLLTGSETVSPGHTIRALERCPDLEVVNCWGPTETTTFSVCGAFRRGGVPSGPLPLGVPLADTEVVVVDEAGMPVPIGTAGELCVAGPILARGYLARPGLTADRFLPHPFRPGERLYRTGDRGRWSVDGQVEFLGRTDHMVKVRGYRVELGEVESVLRDHAAVRECAVITRANNNASVDLVAYLVADGDAPAISDLRAWMGQRLPGYMVPRLFIVLDAMPLTRNGKIDRRALPEPDEARPDVEQEYVAPIGPVEELLAEIWCRVLGVDRVGRHDDFFDLGGDSIRSIQILGQAREAGLAASLATLLTNPTPAGLAAALEDAGRDTRTEPFSLITDEDRKLLPTGLDDAYPMAQLQAGMIFEMERDPDRLPYHNVHSLRVSGAFDEACFREATAKIVARHPILRTSFAVVGYSEPMQLVHANADVPFTVADLRALSEAEAQEAVTAYASAERKTPFDVAVAPMLRMGLHVLSDDTFQWTVTEHHAILDGWSLASVVAEISELYRRLLAGEKPTTTPLRSTYRDFIAAERDTLTSPQSKDFWRDRLAELPDGRLPRWPADRPAQLSGRPAAGDRHLHEEGRGHGSLISPLAPELTPRLRELSKQCGVSFKAVLLAAHLKVIGLIIGSSDLLVGITANGRLEEADGTDVCGLFVNTLPFRMQLPAGSWRELIRAVFETEKELLPHRRYPMAALQRELGGDALDALFETNFVYTDFQQLDSAAAGDGTRKLSDADAVILGGASTNFPLDVTFSREPGSDGLLLEIDYHTDVLTPDQVLLYRDYYARALDEMTADPEAGHQWVSLLGTDERLLLEAWNGNVADVPPTPVYRMFEARAAEAPDAVAVESGGVALTYGELNARANRLARRLRERGVGPDVAVGLCLERSPATIVGLLGILKAGGIYVPIEPEFPAERMRYMLTETAAPLVLVNERTVEHVPDGTWQTLPLGDELWSEGSAENLADGAGPDNGCYVIFTSGSTGLPKGVVTRHRNVTELLYGGEFLTLNANDSLLQLAPLSFDNSTFEVWAPLVGGARLVLAPPVKYGPSEIAAWVAESDITVLHCTASLFALLVDHEPQTFDGLRRFLTGSETVSPGHVKRILERCPGLELVNCWGPTETTTFSVCGVYRRGEVPEGALPLGKPLVNTQVWVLDQAGLPLPIGTPGELYVSGPCLARGYLGRPGLSAERFTPHPYRPAERLYRTGDRGRWSVDGRIEFLGRTDHMVKVRGYRVELGEVESALRSHPSVRECVVVTRANGAAGVDLVAYLVADGEAPSVHALRASLGERLPGYMVPRLFVFMDALPLTPRAKVDRRALPDPEDVHAQDEREYIEPVGELEQQLADIWSQVLRVDRVGRHDDFFDLGGDSIRSIQVLGLAREAGLGLGLRDLLEAPTVAGLATTLAQAAPESALAASVATLPFSLISEDDSLLLPDGLEDAYPMAQLQLGMVYEMERDHALNAYHNVDTVRLTGRFDEATFRDAVSRVVARHPVLRTSFDLVTFSEPLQLVHAAADVPFTVADLRQASADERRDALREYVQAQQGARFDLAAAPLLRMAVHVLSDDVFQWTVTEHHAILDGWSLVSTLTEIVDAYRQLLAGDEPAAEPLRSTFRDFVAAERESLNSPQSKEFWRERLTAAPDARVPRWTADPDVAAALAGEPVHGERHERDEAAGHGALITELPAELARGLEKFASGAAVPLKSVLLAAHLKAISLLTGSADVLIGLTANGRLEETDGAEARGLFLNTVPLRLRLPEGSWRDLARAVFRAERDLLPHRRYPMAVLQREFGGEEPLFEINFTYTDFHRVARLAEDGTIDQSGADSAVPGVARTNFPLDVTFSREPGAAGGLLLELDYVLQEVTADQVARIRDYHLRALHAMLGDAAAHHRATSLLSVAEEWLLNSWQGTDAPTSGALVHELLRQRAAQWPDAVAVESTGGQLTFAELDAHSEAFARRLAAAGVRRGDVVGLHLRPGVIAIVAVWAVWKAGGAFVPLDPELPAARLELMLDDTAPAVVVTYEPSNVPGSWPCLSPDDDYEADAYADADTDADASDVVLPQASAQDLAYVMYTSGSTGRPKGVMIDHGGLANYAEALLLPRIRSAGVEAGQNARVLAGTSAFISDFFLEQILPLLDGHRLLALSGAESRDPRHLVERAQDPQTAVDVIDVTTSQFQLMVEAGLLDAPYPPRLIAIGGEAIPPDLWDTLRAHPRTVAHNSYGPAEAAVDATFADLAAHASPVIGRPYGNVRGYLVDQALELVPLGSVGELVIGGPGVGRGYVGRPGTTAAVFVPDPWGEPGDRLYRTGDLGRYTPDGQIEFLGRSDHQVKILGQRVEPEEVEAALRSHPAIDAAAVTAQKLGGRLQLIAHLVTVNGTPVDRDELRRHLAGRLPSAAVPTVFVSVDALPMTVGGKLDRRALTVPEHTEAQLLHREFVAPRTETEARIAEVWQTLLGLDQVGVNDDFLALGGHSLLAIRLAMRIDLPLYEVFARPTVTEQAELIDGRGADAATARIPQISRGAARALPVSHAQERQWFLWQLAPDNATYNIPWGYEVTGDLDVAALRAAVDALIARHEPFRTTLHVDTDGQVVQRIGAAWSSALTAQDVDEADLPELISAEAAQPFDLSAGPLLRVNVWRLAPQRYVVLFNAHHVAIDEWSVDVFERELWSLYRSNGDVAAAGLAALDVQYADYALWHRELVESRAEEDLAYWRTALGGAVASSWPRSSAARGQTAASDGDECYHTVPAQRLAGLDRLRAQAGATEFMLYLAAYTLLVARRSGERDITVGVPVSGRTHPDLAPLVGFFVNTLVVRVIVRPEDDFPTHLDRVRTAVLEAFAHQEAPFEQVVRAVAPDRADGVNPLFSTMFSFAPGAELSDRLADSAPTGLTVRELPPVIGGSRFDLSLGTTRMADGLHLSLEFSTELFEVPAAGELLTSFAELLETLDASPRTAVAEILRASDREQQLIAGWTGDASAAPVSGTPVHELLRQRVQQWPNAVAVESAEQGELTFAQLDARSEALARRLAAAGVRCGDVVGLHLRPSVNAIVAVWAVWKAGGAFLPLDPALPSARLEFMLDDAAPAVVISQDASTVPGSRRCVSPDTDADADTDALDVTLPQVGSHDLAYIMYTSGSTGRPKGVMVEHGSLAAYAEAQLLPRLRSADIGDNARILTGTSAFISDFFLEQVIPLLDGHRLLMVSGTQGRDPRHLVERAQNPETAVHVVGATTSQIQLMVEAGLLDAPHPPRLITIGGESCPPDLWQALRSRPGVTAHNTYGPAEATVDATLADIGAHASPTIGRPYGAARVYLVDDELQLVPPGSAGEIVIGGPGVGRGYVRRPSAIAAAFVPDPWGEPGDRLYRTGDLGRYTSDGQIEFLGRSDHQVKILGQRIEPEEVEAALRSHVAIDAAAVTAQQLGGRLQLVAHVVTVNDAPLDREEIRSFLTVRLPAAAVPTVLVPVDALPMTVGGKLDRKALTVPQDAETQLPNRESVAPRTETESRVAAVWQAVLGVERVGVYDDFFALGGHSLLAIRLAMRVSGELGADLPLHEVFARPTVAGQAELIDSRASDGSTGRIPQISREEARVLPASHAQERQWFLWQLAPDSATYSVPWGYEVDGELDLTALSAALDAIVERHEPLRTTLHIDDADGQVVQRIGAPWNSALTALDVDEDDLPGLIEAETRRPFDLSAGPVLRVNVWRVAPERHVVLFVAHHVAIDEWSVEVFEREFWALYRSSGDAAAAGLTPLDVQYADYALWHRELVASRAEEDLAYWQAALDGAASSNSYAHSGRTDAPAGASSRTVPAERLAELDRVRAQAGATEFMLYLAVYTLLVARRSGERDVTVGVPVSGRTHPDLAPLVGFFVNTLALRVNVHPEDDFTAHLKRVRASVLEAFAHQEAPFEQVVRAVAPDRADGVNPLFRTMFSFASGVQLADRLDGRVPGGLTLRDLPLGGADSRFDWSLGTTRTADGLHLNLEFSTDHLDAASADDMLTLFADLLDTLGTSPQTTIAEVLSASDRERSRIAGWTGDASVPTCDVPVHELLRQRTPQWPDAVAIESEQGELTFAQLDVCSETLARRLVAAGVRRGDVVGLHLPPTAAAVVAVWAAWKAGGAFLPLDPELPQARLEVMLDDAAPAVVVSQDASTLPGAWPSISPDSDGDAPDVDLPQVGPRDLAYIMYTSGSTGRPKGVMVEHGSLANYAETLLLPRMRTAGVRENARVLTGTSAFISDFFLTQILPMLDGHKSFILAGAEGRDPRHLVELAQDPATAVDVIDATMSQIQLMVEAGLLDTPCPPQHFAFGGEACPPDLWKAFQTHPRTVAHNMYGPAEATVDAAYADIDLHVSPVIGRPYGNARVYLVNEGLELVPPGSVGEIVIGGPGVGRGYVRRPGTTAAVFVPDPRGEPGDRLYRTGDLGRYTADGQIEFLGRSDHQVKILGQRVEPEEVEAALRSHPAIDAAAVTAQKLGGRLQLVAHVVTAQGSVLDRDEMRGYLAVRLPAAAVPTVLVPVDGLPMTVGGKLDRKALTVPDGVEAQGSRSESVAPRTETETRIAAVWQTLLGLDEVGVYDDFFALGGHSLLAIRLAMRVSGELGADLPLHEVFVRPTIAGQAELIESRGADDAVARIPRAARGESRELPASHAQERQWFLWQLAPDNATYNVPWGYEVLGDFDVARLGTAVNALVERHESLRTTLHVDAAGAVVQRIGNAPRSALTALDVDDADLRELIEQETLRPFDLSAGPVLRVNVWRTAPERHVVLFVAHHVAIDEWSAEVFERELWALYRSGGDAAAAELTPLAVQYADYALWHREQVERRAEEDLAYWRVALDGSSSSWPRSNGVRGGSSVFAGDECFHTIPAEQLSGLDRVRAQVGATDFMLYLAVYCLLVARASGERDVTVGVPVSGRTHPDLASLVGFFVNTLALRVTVRPEDDFPTHLDRVRTAVLEAFAHQEAPFEQVVRAVAPDRADSVNPLISTMFSFTAAEQLSDRIVDGQLPDGLSLRELPLPTGSGSRFDLTLGTTRTPDGLHLGLEFSTELFDAPAASELLSSFADLLETLDRSPQTTVSQLLSASDREQRRIVEWTGDGSGSVPAFEVPVHELLRQRVAQWPDVVAVESGDEQLTFAQLDVRSETLARRLVTAGVRRGDVVGLHLRPGTDAIVAAWAVWKSGAAFMPLDPDLPAARLSVMLDDAVPAVVVSPDASAVPGSWRFVSPNTDADAGAEADAAIADVVLPQVGAHDLAYIMYTSGSTGRPKGVMVEHGGLANFAERQLLPRLRRAGVGENARVLAGASAFISDFFLEQVLPLLGGHRLLVLSADERRDPRYLVERAQDAARAVDVICTPTSQVQLMVDAGLLDAPHPPRLIEPAGEAIPPDLWQTLRSRPGLVAHNIYGPAEATVDATCADMRAYTSPILGRPYGNVRLYVVDKNLELVPPGAVGELVIGGPGVGRGYVRRPSATAAVFVPDPWGEPGGRLYRTGDLGRYTPDGQIEFLGRSDHQVKILGQRVEPEEVEAALRSHPAIDAAAVTAQRLGGRLQLIAHLVAASGSALDREEIRAYLAGRLPAAAVPTVLVPVDALPMMAGGKLDRRALIVPEDIESQLARRELVAPRTPTEARIAAVWQTLLGLDQVGVHDDFFALGGHSLTAVRLTLELSRALGTEIPLAQLYTAPTIAEQAVRLDAFLLDRGPARARSVVPLGGTPGARPLVLVHPLGGTLFRYLELAADVESVFETYGVQGDFGGDGTDPADLAGLARRYAAELVPVLAGREPVISGWSAGGVLAHEVARALAELGTHAHRLVLIDSDPQPFAAPDDAVSLTQDLADLDALRAQVLSSGPGPLLRHAAADRLFATLGADPAAVAALDGPTTAALIGFWRAMFAGLAAHRPGRFDGPASLVLARGADGGAAADSLAATAAAWRDLTGTLTVAHADGDHYQLLRRPWVKAVADVLRGSTGQTGD